MSNDQSLPTNFDEKAELVIPAFNSKPAIRLDMTKMMDARKRLIEAKAVNPATYYDLEYTFNEGYRQGKKILTVINYEITQAEKALREARSRAILDDYPQFLKDKGLKDNATIRDAFLEKQKDYVEAQDRIDSLKAMSELIEGSYIKYFENVSRFIKKEMDLVIRSGISGDKYVTK